MPLNFPDSPTLNEIYTSGSNSWQWDGNAVLDTFTMTVYGEE